MMMPCHKCGPLFGDKNVTIKTVGPHIGAYCSECGTWIKWIPKAEIEERRS